MQVNFVYLRNTQGSFSQSQISQFPIATHPQRDRSFYKHSCALFGAICFKLLQWHPGTGASWRSRMAEVDCWCPVWFSAGCPAGWPLSHLSPPTLISPEGKKIKSSGNGGFIYILISLVEKKGKTPHCQTQIKKTSGLDRTGPHLRHLRQWPSFTAKAQRSS